MSNLVVKVKISDIYYYLVFLILAYDVVFAKTNSSVNRIIQSWIHSRETEIILNKRSLGFLTAINAVK